MALSVVSCCNAHGSLHYAREEMLVPHSDMILNSLNTDVFLSVRLGCPSM